MAPGFLNVVDHEVQVGHVGRWDHRLRATSEAVRVPGVCPWWSLLQLTKPGYDPAMEQRVSLITLGVTDLKRARTFYERLGWRGQEVEETVFFQVGGIALVLWGRDKLALDVGINDEQGGGFSGVVLAHNVRSEAEVEDVITSAERAGATVTRRAARTFYGGYAGYFTDPDGYAWEVAHNPGLMLAEDGSITVPDFSSP